MLGGSMKYNVWNKLVSRRLYTDNQITFSDGHGMGEDMTMIRLAACAKRVCYLPQAFFTIMYGKMSMGLPRFDNRLASIIGTWRI